MDSLALDPATWDITTDAYGNLATVGDATPGDYSGGAYRMAQDVACRCMSWLGEVYYDTTQGIRYDQVLGLAPNLVLVQALYVNEALKVAPVAQAVANLTYAAGAQRRVTGQLVVSDGSVTTGVVQL